MRPFSLNFIDKEAEARFQIKEHKERIGLLRIYLIMKVVLGLIELCYEWSQHNKISKFIQAFISLGTYGSYYIILKHKSVKVSYMANFIQVAQPVIIIIIGGALKKEIPNDNLFMFGGFKLVNMASLYLLGTDYTSNTICFFFSAILVSYTYYPSVFSYTFTNFCGSLVWLIVIKYISDRDRRNQFLFKMKDEYWTHIMKDIIDDWVVMVNFNTEKDQITIRDANQNFKTSCNVNDDKSFRTFVRSIHVQLSNETQFKFDQTQDVTMPQNQKQNFSLEKTHDHDIQINKHPDLESILREYLISDNTIQNQTKQRNSFLWQQENESLKVMKFVGLSVDKARGKYSLYSIRMIKGSDSEPFILLVIKKLKNLELIKQMANSQIMQKNLVKMSNICVQYLRITETIYNNMKSPQVDFEDISSTILNLSNSHYVHQLYLNQMHDIEQFKFESTVSAINIKQMIQTLQMKMKNKIIIHLKKDTCPTLVVNSFKREMTHLLLIFIENCQKYSNQTQPQIYIDILDNDKDVLKIQIKDFGPGISNSSIQNYLNSYKINLAREKKRIIVLDHQSFNTHLRSQMRHGWIAARIILSILGPNSSFVVSSDVGRGCSINFTIYKNVKSLVGVNNCNNI